MLFTYKPGEELKIVELKISDTCIWSDRKKEFGW
jgi:hypothetical protein